MCASRINPFHRGADLVCRVLRRRGLPVSLRSFLLNFHARAWLNLVTAKAKELEWCANISQLDWRMAEGPPRTSPLIDIVGRPHNCCPKRGVPGSDDSLQEIVDVPYGPLSVACALPIQLLAAPIARFDPVAPTKPSSIAKRVSCPTLWIPNLFIRRAR